MSHALKRRKTGRTGRKGVHVVSYMASDSEDEATQSKSKITLHHHTEFELQPDRRVSTRTSIIAAGSALELPPSSGAAEGQAINDMPSDDIDRDTREVEDDVSGINDEGYRRDLLEMGEAASHQARPTVSVTYDSILTCLISI